MIRYQHDQQILPYLGLLQAVDEMAQTTVGKGHGIEVGMFPPVERHLERLVAAEGQEGGEPGLLRSGPLPKGFIEVGKSDIVIGTPLAQPARQGEIPVGCDLLIAGTEEVALHIGEVDITSIEHIGPVSFRHQGFGDGGQGLALGRILHDGGGGLCPIAIQDSYYTSVGPERIGITTGKQDALIGQTIQTGGDIGFTAQGSDHIGRETLQQNHQQIGASGMQQGPGGVMGSRSIRQQRLDNVRPFCFGKEIELGGKILLLAQGGKEAEGGIDGGMVQEGIRTEIDHPDIGRRGGDSAPDGNEEQSGQGEHDQGASNALSHRIDRRPGQDTPAEEGNNGSSIEQEGGGLQQEIAPRDTGHGIGR